jgi:hypothetical protein
MTETGDRDAAKQVIAISEMRKLGSRSNPHSDFHRLN